MVNVLRNDFKLNLYFEQYKDYPIVNIKRFKGEFIRKNGNFECLQELIFMIESYQREKYGNLVDYYFDYAPSRKGKKIR